MMASSGQLFGLGQQMAGHSGALPHRIGERDDVKPAQAGQHLRGEPEIVGHQSTAPEDRRGK